MIRSFACRDTEALLNRQRVRRFQQFERVAQRKLAMVHAAVTLDDLRSPPGNRLERLLSDREGQHSIRLISRRICFVWTAEGPSDVEIVDYH